MPGHLSTIGFAVKTEKEFAALGERVATKARAIDVTDGQYLRWSGGAGEELWLQADLDGDLIGMHPHFSGSSAVRVGLEGRVRRDEHTPLDGAFHAWADPQDDDPESGAYPFVFDSPDAAAYSELRLPQIALAQIAAFAHSIQYSDSPAAFAAAQQAAGGPRFASQSFIPSGLFLPDGAAVDPPKAQAIFTGHVVRASLLRNSLTGGRFYWALVDTLGGRFDVVVDRTLLPAVPKVGGVLSGSFWLSGRLTSWVTVKGEVRSDR
jgi:hypothetical protein